MRSCILLTIDLISQKPKLKASDFDLNYKESRKTLNGFKKVLQRQKEIAYSFVGFDSDKSNTYFTVSNPMLNWIEQPKNSTIDICIQIASEFAEQNFIEQITEQLIKRYDFEYGYITKLPSNYDSGTERKIKKGLFSTSVEVNEVDHAWTFNSIGILDGFIKRIYSINYLNKSHLFELSKIELLSKYGDIENITENISKWALNTQEFESLKNNEQIEQMSIITSDLGFLKTEKSKLFKDKMKLKK